MTASNTISSRDRILQRIRRSNAAAAEPVLPVPRGYQRKGSLAPAEVLNLFEERVREYDAGVSRTSPSELAGTIAAILQKAGKRRMAVPAGLPQEWLASEIEWVRDEPALSYEQLDEVDGALTAATVAIALSGSIVLQHGPREGRRVLTLLPDFHLCVVRAPEVVETLPEAMERLAPERPMTFISGPSATADIEMTRIRGVHGPRFLEILLVES